MSGSIRHISAKVCFVFCLAIACLFGGAFAVLSVKADGADLQAGYVSDFFDSDDVVVSPNTQAQFPGGSATGVMLTFDDSSSVKVGNTYAGSFALSYLPVASEDTYSLRKFSLDFSDEDGKSFSLTVYQREQISVSLKLDGVETGIFYGDGRDYGMTSFANFNGMYTSVNAGAELTLRFDPTVMCVYVSDGSAEYLVWNMKNAENDGRNIGKTLSSFGDYTVTVRAGETVGGEGRIMVRSVNGYVLEGLTFTEPSVPEINVSSIYGGLVNAKYYLPSIKAYDLIDGVLDYTVKVFAPTASELSVVNGYFVPTAEGVYNLRITTTNNSAQTTVKNYVITVYESAPEYSYSFDADTQAEYYVGESVYVPAMTLSGGLISDGASERAKVSLYRNGIKIIAASDRESGFYYDVVGAGNYTLRYDVPGSPVDKTFTAKHRAAQFDYKGPETVWVGEKVDFTDAVFKIDGQSADYDFTVEFPTGRMYCDKVFLAEYPGVYKVTATAQAGGKTYKEQTEIVAYSNQAEWFVPDDFSSTDFGRSLFYGKNGIKVNTTVAGSTVVYQKEIDISKYVNQTTVNSNNVTVLAADAAPVIEFAVEPLNYGNAAMTTIILTLAQADDPSNFIKVLFKKEDSKSFTYVQALAGSQNYVGFENSSSGSAHIGGANGNRFKNNYGFMMRHTFIGSVLSGYTPQDGIIRLYYDNEQKQVLARPAQLTNCVINDFDNTEICEGPAWEGFTSDKVILTLEAGTMIASSADYYVFSVDGADLTSNAFVYASAPRISADKQAVYGIIGEEIALPAVRALDFAGNSVTDVITKVYYEKGGKRYDINVADGKFTADFAGGGYVISYIATDCYGQTSTLNVPVTVQARSELSASFAGDITTYRSAVTGEQVSLVPTDMITVERKLGNLSISATVADKTDGDKTVAVSRDNKVFFEDSGTYTVTYHITDETGRTTTIPYDITVTAGDNVEVYGNVPVYYGFVATRTYDIALLRVKDYSGEKAEIKDASVYVNGEAYSDSTYTPQTAGNVDIEYKAGSKTVLGFTVPVIELFEERPVRLPTGITITRNEMKMERLFVNEGNMSAGLEGQYMTLTASGADADSGKVSFINKVSSDYISLKFDIAAQKRLDYTAIDTNVATFDVYLTDALDAGKTVKLSYYMEPSDGKAYISLNDGKKISIGTRGALDGTSSYNFVMLYRRSTGRVYDETGNSVITVDSYLGDGAFEGFGEYCYVSFGVTRKSTSASAKMILYSINGQNISDATSDSVPPMITLESNCEGRYEVGSEVTIAAANSQDVLSRVSYFYMTVNYTDENGVTSVASDVNGTRLDKVTATTAYTLKLDKLGTYEVIYDSCDEYNNKAQTKCIMTTYLTQAPVITLGSEMPEKVALGSTVTLPTYTVAYGTESDENNDYVMYISPSNRYQYVADGSFVANEKGTYRVRFVAIDCFGNYIMVEFEVVCE